MSVNIFQTTIGTDPQLAVNNTAGKYYYAKDSNVSVMVSRGVMFVSSAIMEKDTTVHMELPSHGAFYLRVMSADETRTVVIGKDRPLSVQIPKDFQIQAVCPL